MNLYLVSIGAGLVSALLFAAVGAGSAFAGLLSYLAPLPILIVTLGWHQRAGLASAMVGAAAIALLLRPGTGLAYAISSGLPGWWIGYLALLARPASTTGQTMTTTLVWNPPGRLLPPIAGVAACITTVGALVLGGFDFAAFHDVVSKLVEAFLRFEGSVPEGAPTPMLAGVSSARVVRVVVGILPAIAAASFTLLLTVNLWAAARVARISDRLPRPWPFLPATRMPARAATLFVGAAVLAFLPGFVGVAGTAIAGAFGMAFALQGLGFLHAGSFLKPGRSGGRGVLLDLLYALTFLFGGTMLPLLAVLGLVDSAVPLRHRLRFPTSRPD